MPCVKGVTPPMLSGANSIARSRWAAAAIKGRVKKYVHDICGIQKLCESRDKSRASDFPLGQWIPGFRRRYKG